jgi:signal transduction histidine kinase/ligand-binding sensor domain-containing protein
MCRRHLLSDALNRGLPALVLWLCVNPLPATSTPLPHFVTHTWQTDNGLPQSTATAVLQAQDGYLWIGTYNGLMRFDGVRFVVFDNNNTPELEDKGITCLFEDGAGTLWIGHSSGGVTRYKNGRFENQEVRAKWGGGAIKAINQDEHGDLWLLNDTGLLARLRDGLVLSPPGGPVTGLAQLARCKNGALWVARNGTVSQVMESQAVVLEAGDANDYVEAIGAARDGGLWVVREGKLHKWTGRNSSESFGPVPSGQVPPVQLMETREGWLAAATSDHGFYLCRPGDGSNGIQFSRTTGFPSDWVESMCEDREGELWVATAGAGLQVIRAAKLETIAPPDQWQGRAVLSVSISGRDGAMWIGSEGAGLYRYWNGAWENFSVKDGLDNPYVWSAVEDPEGGVWAGTWGWGVFQRQDNRFVRAPGTEEILAPIPAMLCSRQGGLWIGTQDGLVRYQGGKVSWFGKEGRPGDRSVRAILEDSDGTVWFGTWGGGLGWLKDGTRRQFHSQDGLASDYVTCLHRDDSGVLWIGTAGGLSRFLDGKIATIKQEQGLPNNHICDIEEDGLGYFWMSSHNGIIRAPKADLESCANGKTREIHCLTYGLSDGMPTLECSGGLQPCGCKTADGRLWFTTTKGLVTIDPKNVRSNPLPPPVIIEGLAVDEQSIIVGTISTSELRIPPGRHRFEFKYTALSYAAPEKVQFKCRMEGLEADWVEVGTRRSANYSYIPPGHYKFQVAACNNDGVWNDRGAELAFVVLPYFWQTLWFRILAAAATVPIVGGLVWFDMRRRMKRKLQLIERQRAIERERVRIANDIHDDLGSNLTRITLLSETARSELNDPEQVAVELERIFDTAHDLTRALDEIVWAVNPKHDTVESLVSYLQKFAQDYLETAGIRCRLDLPLKLPAWHLSADVRHHLFLAFKEALHNAVKHADASEVHISLALEHETVVLAVEDDGIGFATPPASEGNGIGSNRFANGNGLESMRRRLAEIGGQCEVWSENGKGTKVRFRASTQVTSSES